MKLRGSIWIILCLLLLAGAWLLWRHPNRETGRSAATANPGSTVASTVHPYHVVPTKMSAPKVFPAALTPTNTASAAAAKTNRFAYRLSNTTRTIADLATDPRAILLRNAFIDTRAPSGLSIPKSLQAKGDPGAYIVQATGPVDNQFRALLTSAGAQIVAYIPNNAYLVSASAGVVDRLQSSGFPGTVLPYEPYYKLSPSFLTAMARDNYQPMAVSQLRLAAYPDTAAAATTALQQSGAKIIAQETSPFGEVFTVQNVKDVAAVAQMPSVQLIEPFHTRVVANDLARVTMAISTNTLTGTNWMGLSGNNVIVEVNDSGIDSTHPDFSATGTASTGPSGLSRVMGDSAQSLIDTDGHGTHVAGIIAGNGSASLGATGPIGNGPNAGGTAEGSLTNADMRGKAPLAELYSVGFLGGDTNIISDRYLQEAAARTNALISNNSWILAGDSEYDLSAASFDAAVRDALATNSGSQPVLFVFAAGNDGGGNDDGGGGDGDTVRSPATAKDVVTVGATEQFRNITNLVTTVTSNGTNSVTNSAAVWQAGTDSGFQVAGYSSRGNVGIGTEGAYGRFKPDVVAPGSFVVSLRSSEWDTNSYFSGTNILAFSIPGQVVDTNSPQYYSTYVDGNAVFYHVNIVANSNSPSSMPDVPIFVSRDNTPDVTNPGNNDIYKDDANNRIWIPPDSGGVISDITALYGVGFNFALTDPLSTPLNYDLNFVEATTNDVGDYFQVLQGLDETLAPYYRYESGTSMAAPAVSGFLALIQDYFTNTLALRPSPALLKAMLINGARPTGNYKYAVTNSVNFEGWGMPNLTNTLPIGITNATDVPCSTFFLDQSPTNTLATGDTHTYTVIVTNTDAAALPLRVTLAWTDPPGDPAAAIKLVNNLDLVVTNYNGTNGTTVYFGNDISGNGLYNTPTDTNSVPNRDTVNNVENVFLPSTTGTNTITIIGQAINVNAVTAHPDNYVQDYALVVSCGEGELTNAIVIQDNGVISNPTSYQNVTAATTNTVLLNQTAGANTPLLGSTNILTLSTNSQVTLGMTNQWHFYVVTNTTSYTNAAFISFLPDTLSIPRTGVYADSTANATRPEADIDMYVARSSVIANPSAMTNLDPTVLAASDKSLGRGGTEFVAYTNAQPGEVYYVGVKSEDNQGAEFGFVPIFSEQPFGQQNAQGDLTLNGLLVPQRIPGGSSTHPSLTYVFALAAQSIQLERVMVTNYFNHENFGDLVGVLNHSGRDVTLNNHDGLGTVDGSLRYDDSGAGDYPGTIPSDGPGSLRDFVGNDGVGVWRFTIMNDSSLTDTGMITGMTLYLKKYQNPQKGINVTIQPGAWFYTFIDVPVGITNLLVAATNLTASPDPVNPLQLYLRYGSQPDQNNFDLMTLLTNGIPPGNTLSDGPPLVPGRYFIGLFNPSTLSADAYLIATLNGPQVVVEPTILSSTNTPTTIMPDAVSSSSMFIANTNPIGSVNVGMVVQYPRISDLTFTLISPTGQRVLLMENRGGLNATNAGHLNVLTNFATATVTAGGANAATNVIPAPNTGGTLLLDYDFYSITDSISIYYEGNLIFGPLATNNPAGPETLTIPIPSGTATNLTIVMNSGGNENTNTAWQYFWKIIYYDYNYLTFTEDTNLTSVPIKFAIPPFDMTDLGTNYTLSGFETNSFGTNAAGTYVGETNIYDQWGGWSMPSNVLTQVIAYSNGVPTGLTNSVVWANNEVSIVSDPANAFLGTNFLALANGYLFRTNTLTPERKYTLSYTFRGPGIAGWWRGEGNASDSADPERIGQNGVLIGRFDFPAGQVRQAFQLEDNGDRFQFAGTNSYVQIPQAPYITQTFTESNAAIVFASALDVGTGPGFTVEGWIDPTNTGFQQPLVEWLARAATNTAVTNISIAAGPFLDRDTGHYYYLLGATDWITSEMWATNLGGHLATVDTANEQNWIVDTFAGYGGTNHNLWIGLTNLVTTTNVIFGYSSGLTNIAYTNWLGSQPTNCDGTRNYTMVFGSVSTNGAPGLWTLADKDGFLCDAPGVTNVAYGVVEVDDLQPNGVQFWISVTNQPGTTNVVAPTNGCLYADLVDITNGDHLVVSPPGLIQSNFFQHVALTYDTNSGIANLYYQGTNVASTNLGYFIPKTTGDVLLGKDMSRLTNNFYGGLMDEMSIYRRALSPAEIAAIYTVSASTTNRLIGKFDPTVTPPQGLAEAQVILGSMTNNLLGMNDQWQSGGFTFTALTNSMIMQLLGLEPGMLFDSFGVSEVPLGNLYYLPEQPLDELKDTDPYGTWTLEIWDTRTGTYATNAQLVSWQMQVIFETNTPPSTDLGANEPTTITIPPGQTVVLNVDVPSWATYATNILDSSSSPLTMYFNQTNWPTGAPNDYVLINNQAAPPAVVGLPVLSSTNSAAGPSTPPLIPGQRYYLALQNTNTHSATAVVEVDYNINTLTNDVIFNDTLGTNDTERYFAFDVDTNASAATFQLLKQSGNADLVVRKGLPFPTLTSSDYGSFNVSNLDEDIYVLTNSTPVPLTAGRWYLGIVKRGDPVVNYSVLAKELTNAPTIIALTNGVPFDFTAGPGAALTNFFSFTVTNTYSPETNLVKSVRFELYHLDGNGDLTVEKDSPPYAPPFFQASRQPGTVPELVVIQTNSVTTNLVATWYLGVPSHETNLIHYTVFAIVDTNLVFPAFPAFAGGAGAEGAGAGAAGGGRLGIPGVTNTVYHVTTLNDSGPGSLRNGVLSTNRTIIFDLSGTIHLLSPLTITNSYLTLAGQTAPGDGITLADAPTVVSGAHDIIIRDLRFRPGDLALPPGGALVFDTVSNVIADHITATWSTTADVSVLNSTNVTVQWSVIADSLYDPVLGYPGYGSRLRYGNGVVSFHHNLYADNYNASPRLGDNLTLDFVNNLIYNWGTNAGFTLNDTNVLIGTNIVAASTNQLNYICNYLIADTNGLSYLAGTNIFPGLAFRGGTANTWIYQTNNFIDSNTNHILDGADTGWNMFTNATAKVAFTEFDRAFPTPPVSVDEAFIAYEKVLDFAGVNMDKRDLADSNVVNHVRLQSGVIIGSQAAVGGWPLLNSTNAPLNTSGDGIPDYWKLTFGQNVTNTYNNFALDASGYSELEEYNNWLAAPHALTVTNTPVGVDLQVLFGRTGNLSFSVTNPIYGTVYLTNVLAGITNTGAFSNTFAIFTPTNSASTTNYYGFASFDVFVTNNATIAHYGPVTVSVFVSAVPPTYSSVSALTNGVPATNSIAAGTIVWYLIDVPTNAVAATNSLLFADWPLNLWWSDNQPPSTSNSNDVQLLSNSTGGFNVINTVSTTPLLVPGGQYYLGVQNTNSFTVTNYAVEVNFAFPATNSAVSPPLTNGVPVTNSVPAGTVLWYPISVPTNADWATNILVTSDWPVNFWFSQNVPPTTTNPNDVEFLSNATNGSTVIGTNTVPLLVPGGFYYLGVENTNSFTVTNVAVQVDFHLLTNAPAITNTVSISNIIYTNIAGTNGFLLVWFAPSNELFQVQWATNLPPVWNTFTNIISYDTNYFTNPTNTQFDFFDDGSQSGGLGTTRFYQLLLLQSANTLTLPALTSFTATAGTPLVVTNTATESNTNLALAYTLATFPTPSVAPSITNGLISWTPGGGDASSEFKFTTLVTDNGVPSQSATNSFTVFVLPYPSITNTIATSTNVTLQWTAPTNDLFAVQWTTNLSGTWNTFLPSPITSTSGFFTFTDTNAPTGMKFYRLDWLTLP